MYDKILHAELRFPAYMNPESKSLVTGMLQRKVEDRLGSGTGDAGDAAEIMGHPYFDFADDTGKDKLDWDAIMRKEVAPEFKPPNRHGAADTSNFDAEFTNERPEDSVVVSNLSETQVEKSKFDGFTFQGESALGGDE